MLCAVLPDVEWTSISHGGEPLKETENKHWVCWIQVAYISAHITPLKLTITTKATAHTRTHTKSSMELTTRLHRWCRQNSSRNQDCSTSFHNRLVLALSVGVQFLWHGKIGRFLPYKNKCVEVFSLSLHNVRKFQRRWHSTKKWK